MARRAWLLVEWVDEKNMIPSYGIVNVDTKCFKESDLQPGKKIFISLKLNEPRRAQIIRISAKKNLVQEHKEFLERQDQQVKNVLKLCMRTIKDMKSEQYPGSTENSIQQSQHNNLPQYIIPAHSENSASDDDSETSQIVRHTKITKSSLKGALHPQVKRAETNSYHSRQGHSPVVNQRRRSVISSTPLPGNRVLENIKLFFDQGTQTDNTLLQPPLAKIEEMESVLKQLYGRFQALVMKVNNPNASIDLSEPEQNDVSYMEPMPIYNESWVPNNATEYIETENTLDINNIDEADCELAQHIEHNLESKELVNVKVEGDRLINKENPMRVRRMSAQTTETDMISLGDGNATVPERLFKDINWNSYTTATRQLLQAVFSRKVLATHSLTGKQSPAHLHKPPKKILDPKLVDDIVKTVSLRCGVPKNLVRNSITVKCTDESKLYRNRQRHRQMQVEHQNAENAPPSTAPSSDESAAHLVA